MKHGKVNINPVAYAGKSLQAAKKMSPQWMDEALEILWPKIQAELKEAGLKTEPKKKKESSKGDS